MRCGLIYFATCIVNNKIYIGKTIGTFEQVKKRHYSAAFIEKRKSKFYCALRKHGWDNFKFEIYKNNISEDELNWYEIWLINTYDTRAHGYNIMEGGDGGSFTSEMRKIISQVTKLAMHRPDVWKKFIDGHWSKNDIKKNIVREKISKANSGRIRSLEHRQRTSQTCKDNEINVKLYKILCPNEEIIIIKKKEGVIKYFVDLSNQLGLHGPYRISGRMLMYGYEKLGYKLVGRELQSVSRESNFVIKEPT